MQRYGKVLFFTKFVVHLFLPFTFICILLFDYSVART